MPKNSAGVLEAIDTNNYYPFGLNHIAGVNNSRFGGFYSYKYNGKELQETGMFDYGWRHYMPDLGRWNGIDQLAEKYHSTSPYAYVANNPVSRFDVDGRWFREDGSIDTSGRTPSFTGGRAMMTSFYGSNPWEGGSGNSFGNTQAYTDIMTAMRNGGTAGLVNQNGTLKWWTDYNDPDSEVMGIGQFNMMKLNNSQMYDSLNNDYWGILNNASTAQSYTTNGIGLTLGTTAQVSNDLVNAGKMIKTSNIFKTYNLYRSNGYLNGNKYISGLKFVKNVKAINAVNSSKIVKGVARLGLLISFEQFRISHHPGYISRGIASFASGYIPYVGPAISLGIDNTEVDYWNIWTWGAMKRGSNHYDYLNIEN
nr:RHS repeat-associated core domain-containing protein [uncultured Chryseobacterium sp.]